MEPLFEQRTATAVTIRCSPEFILPAMALPDTDRLAMYERLFETLIRRYAQWTHVAFELDDPVLASSEFVQFARSLGWQMNETTSLRGAFVRTEGTTSKVS